MFVKHYTSCCLLSWLNRVVRLLDVKALLLAYYSFLDGTIVVPC